MLGRTKGPPRLLVVGLGDLLDLHGVVDDQVHELIETLAIISSCYLGAVWYVLTLILPSMRIESCSYSQTLTVACCDS